MRRPPTSPKRLLLRAAFLAFCAVAPPAQVQFCAAGSPARVQFIGVNANGRAFLNLERESGELWYRVETAITNETFARVQRGTLNPTTLFALTPGPTPGVWQGRAVLTSSQQLDLFLGNLYVHVQSPTTSFVEKPVKSCRRYFQKQPGMANLFPFTCQSGAAFCNQERVGSIVVRSPENVATYSFAVSSPYQMLVRPELTDVLCQGGYRQFARIAPLNSPVAESCGVLALSVIQLESAAAAGRLYFTAFDSYGLRWGAPIQEVDTYHFVACLEDRDVVPPTTSPRTAFAEVQYLRTSSIMVVSGTVTPPLPPTGGQVRVSVGFPGQAATAQLGSATLGAGATSFGLSIQSLPVQPEVVFTYGVHLDITTSAFPNGEIRGPIVQNTAVYGWPGPTTPQPTHTDRLLRIGEAATEDVCYTTVNSENPTPRPRTPFAFTLFDAMPDTPCVLVIGLDLPHPPFEVPGAPGHFVWSRFVALAPDTADPNGCAFFPVVFPGNSPPGVPLYAQWFAVETGANPANLASSEALRFVTQS